MQVFRVYRHKVKGYKAVPMGFSISAFITSFIWAASNSLWGKAFLLFFGFILMGAAAAGGVALKFPMLSLSAIAGVAVLPLWAGMQGQQWVCDRLESHGYALTKRITASSANNAIAAAKRSEDRHKEASTEKNAPPRPAATFGKDFRDVRDNVAANSNQPPPREFNAKPWKRR
ncbi:hypothetical protein [Marinospirillum insulare]|uniref:DUF2628 domain-containing protein n=1 Tax=Marinospirillum insulare TaxID=217169 RepID=A0ABQ5ZWF4_9GAMM|nr:hypothetical protein [Marinospirillum insulare]GLR63345.1 hypothetical protein GCM10007878_07800 [Marinospirillum insulare]